MIKRKSGGFCEVDHDSYAYSRKMFLTERVDENVMLEVIKRLQRVVMIIKLLVDQVIIVMIIKFLVDQRRIL